MQGTENAKNVMEKVNIGWLDRLFENVGDKIMKVAKVAAKVCLVIALLGALTTVIGLFSMLGGSFEGLIIMLSGLGVIVSSIFNIFLCMLLFAGGQITQDVHEGGATAPSMQTVAASVEVDNLPEM